MKRSLIVSLAVLTLATSARADDKKPAPAGNSDTTYAIGLAVAQSLKVFDLTPAEVESVIAGIRESSAGKPRFQLDPARQEAINSLGVARSTARAAKVSGPYLAKAAAEKGATKTASGLIYVPLQEGTGATPKATDTVKVHYTGKLVDGKVFDSSVQRGQPAQFKLEGVIPCWTEGVQLMKIGGKARLVCPASIGYGDRGAGDVIPPGATLDFEVELLEIVK
jgi:FKBP-type peptidyl-prolyl cis-trans isomerase